MPLLRPCSSLSLFDRAISSCRNPRPALSFLLVAAEKMTRRTPKARLSASSSSAAASGADKIKNVGIVREEEMESQVEVEEEFISKDPSKLECMTVKELRELTKKVGVSARGTKKDLISALMSSSDMGKNETSVIEDKRVTRKRQVNKRSHIGGASVSTSKAKKLAVTATETIDTKQVMSDEMDVVRNQVDGVPSAEPWTILAHKKPQPGWVPYNPKKMRPPELSRDTKFVKILSWNVNGLRALMKSKGFSAIELAQKEDFDVLCLQETKIQEKDVVQIKDSLIKGYDHSFWTCSVSKLGYSGTAIISRIKPLSVKYGLGMADHDSEGRLMTVEFDQFYLLCAYVPNSGDGLKRLTYRTEEWDPSLGNYMRELEKHKPVILTGDLNCAHEEIDIYNPAGNLRSAGFTAEERESFSANFLTRGFVDTFRKQNPNAVGYTYWGYRHGGRKTNKGWRLDYFLISESIASKAYDSYIIPEVGGSDHCPVGLVLKL